MRIVIVEDEALAAEKLKELIGKTDPEITVVKVLESVAEAVNWFQQNQLPDLVFMDIQLDDGISFEIFEAIKLDVPVIFTTAYNEYAIRAFKVNSVDYLLKPIEEQALVTALQKFRNHFGKTTGLEEKISKVLGQLAPKYKSRFFVKTGIHFQSVPVENISCFFVEERYTFLKTFAGKTYDLDFSLDHLQTIVDPAVFFRINRNYIINIHAVGEITSYSTSRLKLKNGTTELIVSREKVPEFKQWMDR